MAEPNPGAFDRTSITRKQVFPPHLLPARLFASLLALFSASIALTSPPHTPCFAEVSGGGGSFDYLCCRLIAFLNLCTDVLLHRPGACCTRPRGSMPGEKTNHATHLPPHLLPITDLHLFVSPTTLSSALSEHLLCLFSLAHCSSLDRIV